MGAVIDSATAVESYFLGRVRWKHCMDYLGATMIVLSNTAWAPYTLASGVVVWAVAS